MKKKVLLVSLMVMLFVCLFVISASAATIYKDAEGNELFRYVDDNSDYDFDSYSGSFPKTDASGNELTWYITATTTEGSDTVHTVASLKTLGEAGSINSSGAYSFTSPVTNKNVVSVNFPDNEGIKTFAFKSFGGNGTRSKGTVANLYNSILFAYCPNTLTGFEGDTFQETSAIVVELDDETPITSITYKFAHEARNLEAINIPASVTIIYGRSTGDGAPFYKNWSLETVTFASDINLKTIENCCFKDCFSLKSIDLPNSIEKIGNNAFASCSSLTEISLPNSLKTIANHAFAWCSEIKVIRMGASFEYFNNTGDNSFTYLAEKVEEIYIPKTFYASAPNTSLGYQVSYAFHGASANCKFFYCGTVSEFETAKANFLTQKSATSNNGNFLNAQVITYAQYLAGKDTTYATGRYVICEYNTCDAFYNGIHELDPEKSNACAGICANCGEISQSANPEHELSITITYADFTTAGKRVTACTHENCALKTTPNEEALEAIFAYVGFSLKADNSGSICIGYTVNDTAKAEYEMYNSALEIGVVGYIPVASESPLTVEDGKAVASQPQYTIQADITSQTFTAFDFVIAGFGTNTDVNLVMCAYVCDGTSVYYLNIDQTTNKVAQSTSATTFSYDGLNAYRVANEIA